MDLHPLETLASALALTTSLAAHGSALDLRQSSDVTLALVYAVGTDGTGAEYVVEASLEDSPTTWVPLEEVLDTSGTASGGSLTAPSSQLVRQIVTALPSRIVIVDARGCRWLRVKARETGSPSVAGTMTVQARVRVA